MRAGSGRVKARDSYHHGDLRRALVDTAVRLMAEQGADGFTLRETARAVGVSHAAAYRHFADKEDVLSAIAAQGYRELAGRLRAAIARVPPAHVERRLLKIATAYVGFALEQEPRFRVMTRPRREERRSPELEAAIGDAFGILVGVTRDGVDGGRLEKTDPVDHAMRVYSFAFGYVSLVQRGRARVRPDKVEPYFVELLTPMLAALRAR